MSPPASTGALSPYTDGNRLFNAKPAIRFPLVLKVVQVIANLPDDNSKVDRMWERLLEIALFLRSKRHRKPVEVLKSFINKPQPTSRKISASEVRQLREIFSYLGDAYRNEGLAKTRLATDQTHFYTMISAFIGGDLLKEFARGDLVKKLKAFGEILEDKRQMPRGLKSLVDRYLELSARQTTDISRRQERQDKFIDAITAL